jgi:GT2 family glycosyltransferase
VSSLSASVIVPHYNDLAALDACLSALQAQTFSTNAYEIIVADNASPCGIAAVRDVVRDRARLVEVVEPGAGPARNGGAKHASAPLLAFTDCDCLPEPGWLSAGLAMLDTTDIVGGRMTVIVNEAEPLTPAEAFELLFAFDNKTYVEQKHFTVTANLFVRKADFDRIGPFRTGVSEDQEWCLRARGKGFRIAYAEAAIVGHPARHSWEEFIRKWRRIVDEQYQITREWRFGRTRWLLKTWILPVSILGHLPRILTTPRLSRPGDRIAAGKALIAIRLWRFIEAHRAMLRRG